MILGTCHPGDGKRRKKGEEGKGKKGEKKGGGRESNRVEPSLVIPEHAKFSRLTGL